MHCFFYLICLNTHEVVLLRNDIQLYIQYLLGVRTALYCFSPFVIHTKYFCFYIASIRLHDLDCITYAELVALLEPGKFSLIYGFYDSKINIFIHICVIVINLRLFTWLAKLEARRELSVGTLCNFRTIPAHIRLIFLW